MKTYHPNSIINADHEQAETNLSKYASNLSLENYQEILKAEGIDYIE